MEVDRTYENEWSPVIEDFAKKIANRNGAFQWLHTETANSYTNINKVWSIIIASLMIIFGSSGIPGIVGNQIFALTLTMQVLTIVLGVVTIIQTIVSLDNVSTSHTDTARSNSDLFLFILKELAEKNHKLRIRGDRFAHMIVEKDTWIKQQAPPIPARIVKKYYKRFIKNAVPYDSLFGDDQILKINDEILQHRHHEKSLVRILGQSAKMEEPLVEDVSLEDKIKVHNENNKRIKYIRHVPRLESVDITALERFANE